MSEKADKTSMRHLDEITCLMYLERQLERGRAHEVSAHTDECADCRMLLRALERESRLLTRALLEEEEPMPARLASFEERVRRSMEWVWVAAFGLAATGVYALYTGYIEPWQRQLDQAGLGGTSLLGMLIFQGAFWKGWQSMITLLEAVALVTLAGFAVVFFRRRLRRGTALALVLTGWCALLTLPPAAMATEFRKSDQPTVQNDETLNSDVYLMGDRMRVDGTVEGDVFAFGRTLDVTGEIKGDLISFSREVTVTGKIGGNIRCACHSLTVSSQVGRNVMAFVDTVRFERGASAGGGLTAFSTSTTVDGKLGRDVLFFGDHININGNVAGDVKAEGGKMFIGKDAEVKGHVSFEGKYPPEVSPQAKLASAVDYRKHEKKPEYHNAGYFVWRVIWAAAFVLFGMVLMLLMPKFARETAAAGSDSLGASLGLGVLVTPGFFVAAGIACITVVGLLLGLAGLFLWIGALYCAQVVVGTVIGQWIAGRTNETWPLVGRMALGVVLCRATTMLPYLGGWIKLFLILWGMGAIALALYRRFQPGAAHGSMGVPVGTPLPSQTTVGGMQPA